MAALAKIRLTAAQLSALNDSGLFEALGETNSESVLRQSIVAGFLLISPNTKPRIVEALNDLSKAEDAWAYRPQAPRDVHAARASRILANLMIKVARARVEDER